MSNIVWEVKELECYPQKEQQSNVVFRVHWQCYKRILPTEQDPKTYFGVVINVCSVVFDPTATYTPFESLTLEQVLGWIWASGVDKAAVEAAVEAQIAAQLNPPVVTPTLPWNQ